MSVHTFDADIPFNSIGQHLSLLIENILNILLKNICVHQSFRFKKENESFSLSHTMNKYLEYIRNLRVKRLWSVVLLGVHRVRHARHLVVGPGQSPSGCGYSPSILLLLLRLIMLLLRLILLLLLLGLMLLLQFMLQPVLHNWRWQIVDICPHQL